MTDAKHIADIFAPFGRVEVRRMFSGHGVYADGLFFAMVNGGEVFLKTDEALAGRLREAGSRPFAYTHGTRGLVTTSLWTLPAAALDDEAELAEWSRMALEAARRKAAAKKPKALKKPPPKRKPVQSRAGT